ncbi:MAG: hypothetical protein QMC96_12185 [Methanomicrobiales archaeon]|nr:hypothetical protein [Methanomicrobiales archaeon]
MEIGKNPRLVGKRAVLYRDAVERFQLASEEVRTTFRTGTTAEQIYLDCLNMAVLYGKSMLVTNDTKDRITLKLVHNYWISGLKVTEIGVPKCLVEAVK